MHTPTNEKNINKLLLFMIVLFPWVFLVFQGLDVLEFGYWVVSFENFFIHPEVMPDIVFGSWLTGFIGAIAEIVFGGLGVVGHRIAFIISLYILIYMIYSLLSPFTTKKRLLYFLLLSEIFVNIETYTLTNYYMLTILFYVWGLLLLYKGLISNKLSLLFAAGVVLGLNFYIRIPNILGLSLIIVIIYYDLITDGIQIKQTLKKSIVFLTGFFVAIVAVLVIMKMIGHYELFVQQMNYLYDLLFSNNQGYGAGSLKKKFIYLHFYALSSGLLLFIILSVILLSTKYWILNTYKNVILLVLSVVLAIVLIRLSEADTAYYYSIYLGFIGLTYVLLLWIGYKKFKVDSRFSTIALATLLIFELVPLGSRAYRYQLVYGMYLVIPVIFIYLYSLKEIRIKNLIISEQSLKGFLSLFTVSIVIYAMIIMIYYRAPAN
ncbi:MAG TPA: hypothetical protein EYH42_01090, partial [Sulfurovum sp.]|nr:hypothetical protein [Sulfurovum sp.]